MKLGLQLYSVRDDLNRDLEGTLAALQKIGFKYVETAGYHGKTAREFAQLLGRYGLQAVSMHTSFDMGSADFGVPRLAGEAKDLGVKSIVLPWIDRNQYDSRWNTVCPVLTKIGQLVSNAGFQFCYHNHDFEYRPDRKGDFPSDVMRNGIPAMAMGFELDCYWIAYSGQNPAGVVARFGKRCRLAHLKDGVLGGGPANFAAVGHGAMHWNTLLSALKNAGTEYGFIELDSYDGVMMDAVAESFKFLAPSLEH